MIRVDTPTLGLKCGLNFFGNAVDAGEAPLELAVSHSTLGMKHRPNIDVPLSFSLRGFEFGISNEAISNEAQ
jgi:hypothetical protein